MLDVLEKPPTVVETTKKKPAFDFVPVIFANGIDDDTPGLMAAANDERVHYDNKIYEYLENIVINGRTLIITETVNFGYMKRHLTIKNSYIDLSHWKGPSPY